MRAFSCANLFESELPRTHSSQHTHEQTCQSMPSALHSVAGTSSSVSELGGVTSASSAAVASVAAVGAASSSATDVRGPSASPAEKVYNM